MRIECITCTSKENRRVCVLCVSNLCVSCTSAHYVNVNTLLEKFFFSLISPFEMLRVSKDVMISTYLHVVFLCTLL